jgi:hypothetical protein
MDASLFVPRLTTFGENVWPRSGPGPQRKRDDFLGVAQSINGGCVDPVNAKLERAVNRGDGRFVILVAPTMLPTRSADSPGAKAKRCDGQIGVTQALRSHVRLDDRFCFRVCCSHRLNLSQFVIVDPFSLNPAVVSF